MTLPTSDSIYAAPELNRIVLQTQLSMIDATTRPRRARRIQERLDLLESVAPKRRTSESRLINSSLWENLQPNRAVPSTSVLISGTWNA